MHRLKCRGQYWTKRGFTSILWALNCCGLVSSLCSYTTSDITWIYRAWTVCATTLSVIKAETTVENWEYALNHILKYTRLCYFKRLIMLRISVMRRKPLTYIKCKIKQKRVYFRTCIVGLLWCWFISSNLLVI